MNGLFLSCTGELLQAYPLVIGLINDVGGNGIVLDRLKRAITRPKEPESPYVAATHELRPRQWLNLSRVEERI